MKVQPFIHVAPCADQSTSYGVFAITLDACVSIRENPQQQGQFLAHWLHQQVDLIRALHLPHGNAAFCIRTIVRPKPDAYSAGTVDIAFIGKIEARNQEEASSAAGELCRNCASVLCAAMPNHLWSIVDDRTKFEALWAPFDFANAHFAEIRRRAESCRLDKSPSQVRLGRQPGSGLPGKPARALYWQAPLEPNPTSMARLLRTLLLHHSPTVLQAMIVPTVLQDSEREFLEEEISACEKLLEDDSTVFRSSSAVHKLRVRQLRQALSALLNRLQCGAYYSFLQIASPDPIAASMAQAIGVELISPAAIGDDDTGMQACGFEVRAPAAVEETAVCRANFAYLENRLWGVSKALAPVDRLRFFSDAGEAASFFRFPVAVEALHGISVKQSRLQPVPRELATLMNENGALILGSNQYLSAAQIVSLSQADRNQHLYMVGQTGTGKTTLLKSMIISDIKGGRGLAVVDPHGDLFNELLEQIPPERANDVVLLDPTNMDFPVGLNLLEYDSPDDRFFIARELRSIMERILDDQYGHKANEFTGPLFYQHMQMNLLLAMSDPEEPGTLADFYEIYNTKDFYKRWLPLKLHDAQLEKWVQGALSTTDYLKRSGSEHLSMGEYLSSKFVDFIFDPKLRLIFGQRHSTINFRKIMDEGKILLVNLAKGSLTDANSRFLGMILMAKIQAAAMSRVNMPIAERRQFYLYVDEFQALATEGFITMLSEGRKFGLAMVLANQFVSQIKNERIMSSIFGNVGTLIGMRVGREDAAVLEGYFAPWFDAFDLGNLPNWEACVRTKYRGQALPPFSLRTFAPQTVVNAVRSDKLRALSAKKFGRAKQTVLDEIEKGRKSEIRFDRTSRN